MIFGVSENEFLGENFWIFLDSVKIWFRNVKNWKIKIFWCQRKWIFRWKFLDFLDSAKIWFRNVKIVIFGDFGVSENKVKMRSIYKRGWKIENWENKSNVKIIKRDFVGFISISEGKYPKGAFLKGQNPHFLKKWFFYENIFSWVAK